MDPVVLDFGWLIASYLFGIMLGCLTGLIPGFHVPALKRGSACSVTALKPVSRSRLVSLSNGWGV